MDAGNDARLSAGELLGPDVAYVGEEACFTWSVDPIDAQILYFWGDGSSSPATTHSDLNCHTWSKPGNLLVSAQAVSAWNKLSRSRALLVVPRPLATAPTRSSTLALEPGGERLWVVNPDSNTVGLIDTRAHTLIAEYPVCAQPRTLAISGDYLAVACQQDDAVWQLRLSDPAQIVPTLLPPGSAPYGVVADPRGGFFYASELQGERVVALAVGESGLRDSQPTARDPRGLAMLPSGKLLVTHWRGNAEGSRVSQLSAATSGSLTPPQQLVLPPDTGLDSDTNNNGVPSFMNQVVFSPSGHQAWLPALRANNVSGLFRNGRDLSFETSARAIVSVLEIPEGDALGRERAAGRFAFDDLDFASDVVFSSAGGLAYVALQGSERVVVLDSASFNVAGSIRDAGKAVQGLVLSADGTRLFVQGFLSRSVKVFDVSALSAGPPPLLAEIPSLVNEPLSPDVLLGKQVFYSADDPRMSKSSYLACSSCHLDGEGDNLVWDFTGRGEGLRNTIPLFGREGTGSGGALHWSANFDEVQDFEHDIRGPQQGAGFMSDSLFHSGGRDAPLGEPKAGASRELDALAAYVSSLSGWGVSPARRDSDATWVASRQRGKLLFESAVLGCRGCHTGTLFSDSGFDSPRVPRLHDVGTLSASSGERLGNTLGGIDTPTLRGLWKSAPYLHDGSATTLRAVLVDRNSADQHGQTSALSAAELTDLEAYLLTLDDLEP